MNEMLYFVKEDDDRPEKSSMICLLQKAKECLYSSQPFEINDEQSESVRNLFENCERYDFG